MPTLDDLYPRTRERLAEWQADPEVEGVAWVGSRSRGYGDAMSDDDLEIYLVPAAHARLAPGDAFEVERHPDADPPRLIYDAWRTTLDALAAKALTPADVNHWPYERAVVLFDRDGRLAAGVAAAARMDQAFAAARIQHNALDAIVATLRARKALKREMPVAARQLLARAGKALTRVLFALEGRWTPLDHWLEPELASLADHAGAVPLLRQAILATDPEALHQALERLQPRLAAHGVPADKLARATFHAEVLQRPERPIHALD